jgi:excisionase family DNA binding protein
MEREELLTTGQAAQVIGVSRSTVVRLIEDGILPGFRLPTRPRARTKGHWRVKRTDAEVLRRRMQEQGAG